MDSPLGLTPPSTHYLWKSGAAFIATGMMLGSFGTHALKTFPGITTDNMHAWETASRYAVFNGLGLMLVSMHPRFEVHRFAGKAILGGAAVFSASIYTVVLGRGKLNFLGPITPLGGIVMIAGFLCPLTKAMASATQSTQLSFFASSASSFRPAPYAPVSASSVASSSSSSRPTFSTRNNSNRGHEPLPQSMDPLATDPNILFIHPPFHTFPNSHLHSDGLTYSVMAENPEWFLDANDFLSQNNSKPNAVAYPPHLEPPRGWCPAKKKDLKERGNDGWPEGEEPRLRCTFCRRTYAGVNAKSMWRRHVFEKHKIAMANRRDGTTDRPRGRGSGIPEENKQLTAIKKSEIHDGLINIIVAPQTIPDVTSQKSRFRSMKDSELTKKRERRNGQSLLPLTPRHPKRALSIPTEEEESEEEEEDLPPPKNPTPPLTPHAEESSDPPAILTSEHRATASPPPVPHSLIPESPYNPLQTPSFRHSPARLASEQPWRFPSPSHPLHSTTRDISLTMLAKPDGTPSIKGLPPVGASPMLALHSSPLSGALHSDSSSYETPARTTFLFGRPGAKSHLFDHVGSPLSSGRFRSFRQRITSSPFPLSSARRTPKTHSRYPSGSSDAWFSTNDRLSALSSSTSSLPDESSSNDPFSIWPSINGVSVVSPVRSARPPMEAESPVVRSGSISSLAGEIGLLEPFALRKAQEPDDEVDDDLKGLLSSSPLRGDSRMDGKRSTPPAHSSADLSPPLKKRRMSMEASHA
ncbi:hypothetical protein CPB83DRAFT_881155 [Crepidotus variabilis]|uniref:Uncharacterized protein n=1 Tax=Crepidotus variabilis TaxID=179855 RepID=A0A9P6EMX2_9AGAR|nr:hypothetical protein CPB83DRAFT_881155 [Crepidotus variabilis]